MASKITSLATAREKFINHLRREGRSDYTTLAYGNDIRQLIDFLESEKITQAPLVEKVHIEAFKQDLARKNYTAKSISRKVNAIKTFFRFLEKEGLVKKNPSVEVDHPKYEVKPPRVLSKLEYRALRDACRGDIRTAAIVELMLQTGIRIGEVSNLELKDLGDETVRIKAYYSQPERTIPLNKAAREALNRYLAERPKARSQNLFLTKTSRPLLTRNIRSAISRYFRLAGIQNATCNDLRNTWLAYHLASGTNIVFLAKIAGHKRISSTQKYMVLAEEKGARKRSVQKELKEL